MESERHLLNSSNRTRVGMRRSKALLLALVGAVAFSSTCNGPAASLFARSPKKKVLFQARGYELLMIEGKGKVPIPSLKFQQVPPKPLIVSGSGSIESGASKGELIGFPFTTQNAGTIQLGFPRIGGRLTVAVKDPPQDPDAEEMPSTREISYEQSAPGIGDITAKVRTNGEWGASISREVEDIGQFRGGFNSQLDWNLDLETSYDPVYGLTPSVTYGATQDGMRVKAHVEGDYEVKKNNLHASYTLQNIPGKYSPTEFLHDANLRLSTPNKRHTLEATASVDPQFSNSPVHSSFSYALQTSPATFEASIDQKRYRLKVKNSRAEVSAAIGYRSSSEESTQGKRPAELELRLGKVATQVRLDGNSKPRVRVEVSSR